MDIEKLTFKNLKDMTTEEVKEEIKELTKNTKIETFFILGEDQKIVKSEDLQAMKLNK